jgi:hypothetical protein
MPKKTAESLPLHTKLALYDRWRNGAVDTHEITRSTGCSRATAYRLIASFRRAAQATDSSTRRAGATRPAAA